MLLWILIAVLVAVAIAMVVAAILQRPINLGPDPLDDGIEWIDEDPRFPVEATVTNQDGHESKLEVDASMRPGDILVVGSDTYVIRKMHRR